MKVIAKIVANKKRILSLILIVSLAFIAFGGIIGYSMLSKGVILRYSSLKSYDGTQIAVLIAEPDESNNRFGDKKYGVVVAHGIVGKAESNIPLIVELARAGFTVIALDERGHGNSGGAINRLHVGEKEYQDVVKCAEYLHEDLNCQKICLVGHSLGGLAVTRASIWAEEEGIVDIAGTIAISIAIGVKNSKDPSDPLNIARYMFSKTFYLELRFAEIEDEMSETGPPYNYLVIVSENDDLIDKKGAEKACDYAGGSDKTNETYFENRDASDFYLVKGPYDKTSNAAPGHGDTVKDPRVVAKVIDWFEKVWTFTINTILIKININPIGKSKIMHLA